MKKLILIVVFVVSWDLYVQEECPNYKPDAYGRWPNIHCAFLHIKTVKKSKQFDTRKEAYKFIEDSGWKPMKAYDFFTVIGGINNFKIEEIK